MISIVKTITRLFAVLITVCTLCAPSVCAQGLDEEDPYVLLTEEASKNIEEGKFEAAADRLKEAIAMRPDAPENVLLLSNLGMVYSYMDRNEEALSTLNQALKIAPRMRTVLSNRARVLLKMGRDVDAYKDLDKVIAADSLNLEARYLHGLLAVGWRYMDTAEADFAVLKTEEPTGLRTAVAMSSLLTAQGNHRDAIPYQRKLVEMSGLEDDYAALATSLLETEDLSGASATISEGLEKYPDSGELYFCRARLNAARYSYNDARADAKKAVALGIEQERVKTLGL